MAGNVPLLTIKGLTPVRRDSCQWVKDTISGIIVRCMDGYGFYSCVNYVKNQVVRLYNGEVNIDDLVITKGMGANYDDENATMKVFAGEMAKRGMEIHAGERHKFIVCNIENYKRVGQKMMLLSLYCNMTKKERPEIDYEYYFKNLLMKKVDVVLAAEFSKYDRLDKISLRSGAHTITAKKPAKLLSLIISNNLSLVKYDNSIRKIAGGIGIRQV